MNHPFIDIRHLTAYRGGRRVLDDFSFRQERGAHTALLGPNGSGKTTLMKLVSGELYGLDRPGSSVRVFGRERWDVHELRRRLGILSHDLQREYLPGVSGRDVVLSGAFASIDLWRHHEVREADRSRAGELMEELGVTSLADRRFSQMSTGEQRRCLLARALFANPDALLFDEPTSGLDLRAAFAYLWTLGDIMRQGRTVLLVTHHVHEIPPEIKRVVLLKEGRIMADGPREDVLTAPLLSDLFETPLQLAERDGWHQVFPAR
ncbi:ATP-binding cassette domain-containing protein [Chlorobium sp. N1]|uniref:ABC transporter ATP-binding protein n=1 Tax=Chlorobium sp. N1 TaxID=2491138 RepID=UPI00103942B4|nr:ATP-binding cassette domain-containing protein [Chlorobium sp. N1]TCD47310.1 ATP-binding cassette domain-containing protein [Chlorobium sp. N1]